MIAIHKLPSAQTLAILVKRACLSEDDQLAIFLCATSMALEAVATLAENERGNAVLEESGNSRLKLNARSVQAGELSEGATK